MLCLNSHALKFLKKHIVQGISFGNVLLDIVQRLSYDIMKA
jgi:hypothetical protein